MSDVHNEEQGICSRAKRGQKLASKMKNNLALGRDGLNPRQFTSTQKHNPLGTFSNFNHHADEYDNKNDVKRVKSNF